MAVLPQRPRLIGQRQLGDALGELGIVEIAVIDLGGGIGLADHAVAIKAIGDAGGLAHQVENRRRPVRRHQFERLVAVLGLLLDADFDVGEGGNVFRDGILEPNLPSSISIIATTLVIGLVIENRRKMVSSVIGALVATSRTPKNS